MMGSFVPSPYGNNPLSSNNTEYLLKRLRESSFTFLLCDTDEFHRAAAARETFLLVSVPCVGNY